MLLSRGCASVHGLTHASPNSDVYPINMVHTRRAFARIVHFFYEGD
jgi:hypothetical protein